MEKEARDNEAKLNNFVKKYKEMGTIMANSW